ncbi:MAG TPA: helix-turn-helix transcriptional regulator [Thermaerobacter sp.]
MQQNPITAYRERRGWTRRELALRTGLGYTQLTAVELGHPPRLPPGVLQAFEALGEDPGELAAAYQAWREAQRAAS